MSGPGRLFFPDRNGPGPLPLTAGLRLFYRVKIIVTGGGGFIGRTLVRRFREFGHTVQVVDLRAPLPEARAPVAAVVHCAWAGVDAAHRSDADLQAYSFGLFLRMLNLADVLQAPCIVSFGSQAELYQDSAYAAAKRACRGTLQRFGEQHAIRTQWLRLFSVYGPEEGAQWFIPSTIRKLLAHEPMDFTPGRQRLDYLHVADVAGAVEAALTLPHSGEWNVNSGTPRTLRSVVETLVKLTGSRSELHWGALPYRPGQVMDIRENSREFQRATGWRPLVQWEDGLRTVVRAVRQQMKKELV